MPWLNVLATVAIALLAALPAQAQEAASFQCTFTAAFETIKNDHPTKSDIEKQFVGHRLDVRITDKPSATVVGDVFTVTRQSSEYFVSQRGSARNDWVLHRTDTGAATRTITVIHIRTWHEPVRFSFAWGSTLAIGTCEQG
jgi:hypothetical protein